jgi:predicted Zn-dependent protease
MSNSKKHYSDLFKQQLELAFEASRLENYCKVLDICDSLLREKPRCKAVLILIGEGLWRTGNLKLALKHMGSAVKIFPISELISLLYFQLLLESGNRDLARNEIARFLKLRDSQEYNYIITEYGWKITDYNKVSRKRLPK